MSQSIDHMLGNVKDSLTVQSRASGDPTRELSGQEDGICTMRGDSHLEATHMRHMKLTPATTNS